MGKHNLRIWKYQKGQKNVNWFFVKISLYDTIIENTKDNFTSSLFEQWPVLGMKCAPFGGEPHIQIEIGLSLSSQIILDIEDSSDISNI